MKLELSNDGEIPPGVGDAPITGKMPEEPHLKPIVDWIEKFPYEMIEKEGEMIEKEGGIFLQFRCGEMRNDKKEFRRLRVSICLTEWMEFNGPPKTILSIPIGGAV